MQTDIWYPLVSVSHVQKSHARPPTHAWNACMCTGASVSQGDTKAASCAQHPVQAHHCQCTCSHHISLLASASQQIMHDTECCIMLLNCLPMPHSLIPLLESLITMNWCTSLCSRSHLLGRGRECMQMLWEQCCCVVSCGHLVEEGLRVGAWSVECWTLIVDGVTLSQSCAKITSLSDATNKGVQRPSNIFSSSKSTNIYKSCDRDCTWQYLELNLCQTGSKWSLGSVTHDLHVGLPLSLWLIKNLRYWRFSDGHTM